MVQSISNLHEGESMKSKMKKTEQTSAGLCEALFEEFDLLRNDLSDAHRASSIAKLAVQIINTKKLEIEAAAFHKAGLRFVPLALTSKGLQIGAES
jgi:S-adenosylmethionine/arginine decarboxylase-like enzyme